MENTIIISILLIILVIALLRAKKHFKSGGCCGSGSTSVRSSKKLTDTKLGQFTMSIEGMHCENCQNRIEHAVNRLDGVVCKVNLKKKSAVVSYSREVSRQEVKEIVEKLGFVVTDIQ